MHSFNEEREEKRGGKIIMEWVTSGMTVVTGWFNGLFDVISGNAVLGAIFVGTVLVFFADLQTSCFRHWFKGDFENLPFLFHNKKKYEE